MTDKKTEFNVNINDGDKQYVEDSFAALIDFSVTVTRKYIQDGNAGFDVVGTEMDSYVAQLQSNDDGDAVKETLNHLEKCRDNWSVMGAVKDDEESKKEFINNIQNLSSLSALPEPEDPQRPRSEDKDG